MDQHKCLPEHGCSSSQPRSGEAWMRGLNKLRSGDIGECSTPWANSICHDGRTLGYRQIRNKPTGIRFEKQYPKLGFCSEIRKLKEAPVRTMKPVHEPIAPITKGRAAFEAGKKTNPSEKSDWIKKVGGKEKRLESGIQESVALSWAKKTAKNEWRAPGQDAISAAIITPTMMGTAGSRSSQDLGETRETVQEPWLPRWRVSRSKLVPFDLKTSDRRFLESLPERYFPASVLDLERKKAWWEKGITSGPEKATVFEQKEDQELDYKVKERALQLAMLTAMDLSFRQKKQILVY